MINLYQKYKTFFLIFALFLVSSILQSWLKTNPEFVTDKESLAQIQSKIKAEEKKIQKNIDQIITEIKNQKTRFNYDLESINHPIYVYKDGELFYWNEYRIAPDYSFVNDDYLTKYLALKNGKFIARKNCFYFDNHSYEILGLIKLSTTYPAQNQYLKNSLEKNFFSENKVQISKYPSDSKLNIYSIEQNFLFSIEFLQKHNSLSIVFNLISIIFLLLGLYLLIKNINQYRNKENRIKIISLVLIVLILFFILLTYPLEQIFNDFLPRLHDFRMFWINPYELISTILCFLALIIVIMKFSKFLDLVKWIKNASKIQLISIYTSCILLQVSTFVIMYSFFYQLEAYFPLSISEKGFLFEFKFKIISIFLMITLSSLMFLINHSSQQVLLYVTNKIGNKMNINLMFIYSILLILASTFLYLDLLFAVFSSLACTILVQKLKLSTTMNKYKFISNLYLFLFVFFFSILGVIGIFKQNKLQSKIKLNEIAKKIDIESNEINGSTIKLSIDKISDDQYIKQKFYQPTYEQYLPVIKKIERVYLKSFFQNYEIKIFLFDAQMQTLLSNNQNDFAEVKPYLKNDFQQTIKSRIYKIDEFKKKNFNNYMAFLPLMQSNTKIGNIIITLKLRKIIPNSVYPRLLLDQNYFENTIDETLNYATYFQNEIVNTSGKYNYFKNFKNLSQDLIDKLIVGYKLDGYNHKIFINSNQKSIIVSNNTYPIKYIFSNFSILFTFYTFLIAVVILVNTILFSFNNSSITFSTKIQIYLNLALFVPLFVVSASTFGVISSNFLTEIQENNIQKAETVSDNMSIVLKQYFAGEIKKEVVNERLIQMSTLVQSDMSIYDPFGKQIFSTQPKIFESGLLSSTINRKAFDQLIFNREKYLLTNEQIGDLNYNAVYFAIKSFETGKIRSILAIPYFDSTIELRNKIGSILGTILIIFCSIFILFLILTFIATDQLTEPLRFLSSKLKKTNLNNTNEPLYYPAEDEIGMLVKSYNLMINKLDKSKQLLALNEKESAWREMARQVAHEIKNPLTPMKLTIQHLQRMIKNDAENLPTIADRSINTLLVQIDSLDEIASSFSLFNKLPEAKEEVFDVIILIKSIVNLFENNHQNRILFQNEITTFNILGDEKVFGRILTNLLTNAIQAIPIDKLPEVIINCKVENNDLLISIKDNGTGIPLEIQDKVFLPNFSTKYAGTGIGLALCKKGIEQMKGDIWFETELQKGTIFFIKIHKFLS